MYEPYERMNAAIMDSRLSWLQPIEHLLYKDTKLDNTLQHEMSHWFGAKDIKDKKDIQENEKNTFLPSTGEESVMDYTQTNSYKWDKKNKTLMRRRVTLIFNYPNPQKDLKTEQD